MWKDIVKLASLALVATALIFLVFGHSQTLQERALAAYKAGDYAKAMPLFKQMAATPEVRNNVQQRNLVMAYIFDMQLKLKPGEVGGTGQANVLAGTASSGTASTNPTAGNGTDQSSLVAQAMAFALETKKNPTDPATGADRVPHEPFKPGEIRTMTIKQLGNFEVDQNKGGDVPADVKTLDGGTLRLNGFMIPLTQAERISEFALVPSLFSCCFGQPPGVQHVVTCHMPANKAVDYSMDEIVVEGVLHVKITREDGYTSSIFELDATSVKQKE